MFLGLCVFVFSVLWIMRSTNTYTIIAFEDYFFFSKQNKLDKFHPLLYDNLNGSCVSTFRLGSRVCNWRRLKGDNRFLCVRDRTNIRDALENHEENENKDLSSTICKYVSLECTPQVRYKITKNLGSNFSALNSETHFLGWVTEVSCICWGL